MSKIIETTATRSALYTPRMTGYLSILLNISRVRRDTGSLKTGRYIMKLRERITTLIILSILSFKILLGQIGMTDSNPPKCGGTGCYSFFLLCDLVGPNGQIIMDQQYVGLCRFPSAVECQAALSKWQSYKKKYSNGSFRRYYPDPDEPKCQCENNSNPSRASDGSDNTISNSTNKKSVPPVKWNVGVPSNKPIDAKKIRIASIKDVKLKYCCFKTLNKINEISESAKILSGFMPIAPLLSATDPFEIAFNVFSTDWDNLVVTTKLFPKIAREAILKQIDFELIDSEETHNAKQLQFWERMREVFSK